VNYNIVRLEKGRKIRRTVGLVLLCFVFAFQFLSLVRASSSFIVGNAAVSRDRPFPPPIPLDDEPAAIPDSQFVERYGDKYQFLLMLAEAFYSTPESHSWNPAVDLNNDNVVNICDAIIIAEIL
jgi:hypothetical protein